MGGRNSTMPPRRIASRRRQIGSSEERNRKRWNSQSSLSNSSIAAAICSILEFNHELWAEIQRIQESVAPADDDVLEDLEKSLHVHVVLGLSDGTTRGGHLVSGTVRPHKLGCGARR
jgi:hypothetical protein